MATLFMYFLKSFGFSFRVQV